MKSLFSIYIVGIVISIYIVGIVISIYIVGIVIFVFMGDLCFYFIVICFLFFCYPLYQPSFIVVVSAFLFFGDENNFLAFPKR